MSDKGVEWLACKSDVYALLRSLVRCLLEEGEVSGVASGEVKEEKISLRIVRDVKEVDEAPLDRVLLYGYRGLESPVRAVRDRKGERLAILVKPCEARALIELSKRKQVSLSSTFVAGFDCPGVSVNNTEGSLLALSDAPEYEVLREACKRCEVHTPPYSDVVISLLASADIPLVRAGTERGVKMLRILERKGIRFGNPSRELLSKREEKLKMLNENGKRRLEEEEKELLSKPAAERFSCFMSWLDSCIKCGACIRACPICYCKDCIVTARRKDYAPSFFLVTKMLHMADSCVCCGKCDEVCPKSIPLSYIFYHLGRRFASRYNYLAGVDFSNPPRII
ncbi:MAG: 4Fe-4S dicluster domain-containing protein [Candidatus Jordarchaeales archaeon]